MGFKAGVWVLWGLAVWVWGLCGLRLGFMAWGEGRFELTARLGELSLRVSCVWPQGCPKLLRRATFLIPDGVHQNP